VKLYEINAKIAKLIELSEESEGELSEAQFADLSVLNIEFDEKVQDVALYALTLKAEAVAIDTEIKRLAANKERRTARIDQLKSYLIEQLNLRNLKRAGGAKASVRVQKNAPSVEVLDETQIPLTYWVPQEPTLNRTAILADLKAGKPVPGTQTKQGEHLRFV